MSKNRGSSNMRKLKRVKLKVVQFKTFGAYIIYQLSKRGLWIQKENLSAQRLTTNQINKLIERNNG